MGGFGSGGSRPGAGRKRKPTHLRAIDGGADRRGPRGDDDDAELPPADAAALEPPDDLSPEERAVWDAWAPLAIAERTLTPATLANFVQLCQAEVDRRHLRARYTLQRHGAGGELLPLLVMDSDEELSLRREHRTLLKDIHARMKDFKLAPFGKEILPSGQAAEEDPLDQFTRKRG
jgi:hypothetical protein